jgi:hypothetical protein
MSLVLMQTEKSVLIRFDFFGFKRETFFAVDGSRAWISSGSRRFKIFLDFKY